MSHECESTMYFTNSDGKITSDYFRTQGDRELAKIKFHLVQFRLGSLLINDKITNSNLRSNELAEGSNLSASEATTNSILEKLAFIESVVSKYRHDSEICHVLNGYTLGRFEQVLSA